ncbi:hypothetical protein [Pseudoalteromonas denitrificans]|uniref:Glycogen debranching enzyme (Alpha-1,6-glucosidase) n=1 Tax=Pseudoalteromonas denitrificans DSM 6059 TaxID=1123010 RepID=A0A1I1TQD8_9GAMM|nr:hypothetical protein [Pseudoalteromonas denitrificans]SFD60807.1 Glycogen debranching enzyme (alpha-1,6-glucosidase) [Pseudoalteromonas denitrificans DSM 6059]
MTSASNLYKILFVCLLIFFLGSLEACHIRNEKSDNQSLYLRGSFNGWGINHVFNKKSPGIFTTKIEVTPGNYSFKVASDNWTIEYVINPYENEIIIFNKTYILTKAKASEDSFLALKTGSYLFTLDLTDKKQAKITVKKLALKVIQKIDPHKNSQTKLTHLYSTFDHKNEVVTYSVDDESEKYRTYIHSSSMSLRDPGQEFSKYTELENQPLVRSGNLEFDALFALAINEMKLLSVSNISDGNYDSGKKIACECFKTGEKWAYVWTRDLSYAADLSLALLDPIRVKNALNFKTSHYRKGIKSPHFSNKKESGLQIIQDTGSGGSWPISTDRITWAFAAEEVLKNLVGDEKKQFSKRVLIVLKNTIENDRLAAFDEMDGLYTGEQSFLDWREQTYATWIVKDLSSMATSKALSTNAGHYLALILASKLSIEQGDILLGQKYQKWAQKLKKAINHKFWLEDAGMYSSLVSGHFDKAALYKFDWLGQSLAVITGIAENERAQKTLANYPHGPMGAPVIFPQQAQIPIYHNRAIWPFVTAYGLKAANKIGQVSVADAAYNTLIRGAALNMSNMENLEWLSGQPMLLDSNQPELSGPVINSKYQLWSVAAYLNMVIENIFGVSLENEKLLLKPFITKKLHETFFKNQTVIELKDLKIKGKNINLKILLPKLGSHTGFYQISSIHLNGKKINSDIVFSKLKSNNQIKIILGKLRLGQNEINMVHANPYEQSPKVFSPLEPKISDVKIKGEIVNLMISKHDLANNNEKIRYNLYRNGKRVAENLLAGIYQDHYLKNRPVCYALEAINTFGNRSHHSKPVCIDKGIEILVNDKRVNSNVEKSMYDKQQPVILNWGKANDTLIIDSIEIKKSKNYAIQVKYHNDSNVIGQGITAGVKVLTVFDNQNQIIKQGIVQLPHTQVKELDLPLAYSTPLTTHLNVGNYRIELTDFYNMSYLTSNDAFTGKGGENGAVNQFDFYGLRLLPIQ